MNSLDVIKEIIKKNNIEEFATIEFPDTPMLQNRLSKEDKSALAQINKALEIREQLGLPFWDSILLTFKNNSNYSKDLLQNVLMHNNFKKSIHYVSKEGIQIIEKLTYEPNKNFGINSRVVVHSGEVFHVPLIDFNYRNNKENLNLALDIIQLIYKKKFYLLESGESYHFYGLGLLKETELTDFLGKALQFSPAIDKTWISHQLREGSCCLRFTPKNTKFPTVVFKN